VGRDQFLGEFCGILVRSGKRSTLPSPCRS
jgi:hypothetical protein